MVIVQIDNALLNGAGFQSPEQIVKRDGRVVSFDPDRIWQALRKCFAGLGRQGEEQLFTALTQRVVNIVTAQTADGTPPTVERVQDTVETVLQAAGEFEAAKKYILYRERHAQERAAKPIPDDVRAAFELDATYFPTPLQRFMYYDKYARFSYETGRRETYPEAVQRVVEQLRRLVGDRILPPGTWGRIAKGMLGMTAMPSMRMLSMAGEAFERDNATQYNCYGRETKFISCEGVRSFQDFEDGDETMVLTHRGNWKRAKVRVYGLQEMGPMTVRRTAASHTFRVTRDHRWLLKDGSETTSVKVGDGLAKPPTPIQTWDYYDQEPDARLMWAYGFVYGDGTLVKDRDGTYKRSMVRLCGDKTKYLDRFQELGFAASQPPSCGEDVMVYTGRYLKKLPLLDQDGVDLVRAFVIGYLDADGTKGHSRSTHNPYTGIQASKPEAIEFIRNVFPAVGAYVTSERIISGETNLGEHIGAVTFGLMTGTGESHHSYHYVREIDAVTERDEAWCLEVEDDHSFVMPTGIVTGNCTYLPIDSIDAWCEAMWLSMAGCGVGFSVEEEYVDKLPRVQRQKRVTPRLHVVQDSSEGWCEALRAGCEAWFAGEDVRFNYDLIRPRGAILKVKGGRASGKDPLVRLLDFARTRILARQGSTLRPIDAHDIACAVGGAAVSGGVRRTAMISIFDYDDTDMLRAKAGDFERENSQRWNANNSTVWDNVDLMTQEQFIVQFLEMVRTERGEPGIFNREAARDLSPNRRNTTDHRFGSNPCGEIILRPWGMCNLTTVVARHDDTLETLMEKVRTATIIGTIQSMGTYFPYLRKQWEQNCQEERLLGVSIGGQLDTPLLTGHQGPATMAALREEAIRTNGEYADILGISRSAAITCVKPDGNSSQLLDMSSGLHARWAPYYVRNVRVSGTSALARVMREAGVPMEPENGDDAVNPHTWVISFPVKAPEGAITRNDRSVIDQCNYWLMNKRNWTEHNPSCTITYKPDEVLDLMQWVWKHRKEIGGMAFLPTFDAKYAQLPYVEIDAEEYERRAREFPEIDFAKVYRYESEDWTTAAQEMACLTGLCEIQQ